MERLETRLEGPALLSPVVHRDERGFFQESYRRNIFGELGIPQEFVQDNHSRSALGVRPGHVVQLVEASSGWPLAEGAVWSSPVIELEPAG
jgi:dTDP-4-dehydrorhamnose 3,5-epimerase-like enzyme